MNREINPVHPICPNYDPHVHDTTENVIGTLRDKSGNDLVLIKTGFGVIPFKMKDVEMYIAHPHLNELPSKDVCQCACHTANYQIMHIAPCCTGVYERDINPEKKERNVVLTYFKRLLEKLT